jgi:hypothetical protein
MEEICIRIICGQSIVDIVADKTMPGERDFYKQLACDPVFAGHIARAREAQQDYEAEKMIKMADEATPEDWQVVKMRIWARQWRAAKLAPKKYGEKMHAEIDVNVTERRQKHIEIIREMELRAQERRAIEAGE